MIIQNNQIYNLYESLYFIITNKKNNEIPVVDGFNICKNERILEPYYTALIEMRQTILQKYGTINSDGQIILPSELIEQVNIELNELLSIDNEIQLQPIPLESLRNLYLPLEIIQGLMPIISEG